MGERLRRIRRRSPRSCRGSRLRGSSHVVRTPPTAGRSWPRSPTPAARWSSGDRRPGRADFAVGALATNSWRALRLLAAVRRGGDFWRDPGDDVRRVGLALPRTDERVARGRPKLQRRGRSSTWPSRADETLMRVRLPEAERDGLVASDPETFFLPGQTGPALPVGVRPASTGSAPAEMRELVTDAWRMCAPRMLHDLPELPARDGAAWADEAASGTRRTLLHRRPPWSDGARPERPLRELDAPAERRGRSRPARRRLGRWAGRPWRRRVAIQ